MEPKYKTVLEFFEAEHPEYAQAIQGGGGFWPKVLDNTISNEELDGNMRVGEEITGRTTNSTVYMVSSYLLRGRATGKVANPG